MLYAPLQMRKLGFVQVVILLRIFQDFTFGVAVGHEWHVAAGYKRSDNGAAHPRFDNIWLINGRPDDNFWLIRRRHGLLGAADRKQHRNDNG